MRRTQHKQDRNEKFDPCQNTVIQILQSTRAKTLWITDENFSASETISPEAKKQLLAITNRLDVQQKLLHQDIECLFNDFDFTGVNGTKFDQVVYRLSKEKAVIHHILNSVYPLLSEQGKLILIGQKNDGIKRFSNNAELFFSESTTEKNGICYTTILSNLIATENRLDDDSYEILRPIATLQAASLTTQQAEKNITLYSKPGTFGWEKVDAGSQFLISHLAAIVEEYYKITNRYPEHLLDLGCGYGYLTMMTASMAFKQRIATDNNAAALLAMQHNANENQISVDVIAANCADEITTRVDLLLCNPPFHQGFQTDENLTNRFLEQSKNHLTQNGMAVFVVNAFIPLENKAKHYFRNITEVANNKKFKVFVLSN